MDIKPLTTTDKPKAIRLRQTRAKCTLKQQPQHHLTGTKQAAALHKLDDRSKDQRLRQLMQTANANISFNENIHSSHIKFAFKSINLLYNKRYSKVLHRRLQQIFSGAVSLGEPQKTMQNLRQLSLSSLNQKIKLAAQLRFTAISDTRYTKVREISNFTPPQIKTLQR